MVDGPPPPPGDDPDGRAGEPWLPPPGGPPLPPPPPPGPGPSRPAAGGWRPATPRLRVGVPGHLLPLRPLEVGDVLDGAFRLLRVTFLRAAVVLLVVLGPVQLLTSLALWRVAPELSDPDLFVSQLEAGSFDPAELFGRLGTWAVGLQVISLLANVLAASAVVALISQADRGHPLDVVAAIRTALERSGATIGASVLAVLSVLVGLALLVPVALGLALVPLLGIVVLLGTVPIVAVAVTALFSLVIVAGIQEPELGAWGTFRRALWVLRVRFWAIIGITLLLVLVLLLVGAAVALPLTVVSFVAGSLSWVVDGLSSTLIALVTVPVSTAAAVLFHLDARVRREGYDLLTRARHLEA